MQYNTILLFWFNDLEVDTILLFWFNDFEVFSLAHKSKNWFYLLLICFPSCGWNNWSLEEWTSATELFKLFLC